MVDDAATKPPIELYKPPEITTKLNGVVNALLASPLGKRMQGSIMTIEFTGRKTGKTYRLPVGHQQMLGKLTVLTRRTWAVNFRGGADARLRLGGEWKAARGSLVEDTDTVADGLAEAIDRVGWDKTKNTIGLVVNVGRAPTREELETFLAGQTMRLVQLDVA
jgi:hypothetical protein